MAATVDKARIRGSLYGLLVGDAISVCGHWFYSPTKLRADYGEIRGIEAPKPIHAESMAQTLSDAEIAARRDDHGNYVGAVADARVHYHKTLTKGQNTANVCVARLLTRYLGEKNAHGEDHYDPDEFLERFATYMTTAPDSTDTEQLLNHNDLYLDVYMRKFFTQSSTGQLPYRACAPSQRDQWSIGSLDGVVLAIPIVAAYATEPEAWVIGRAVEHHMLTHRSITVTAVLSVLVPLLLELYRGANLKESLDRAMLKLRPPKCTGRAMRDSYVDNHGPHNIPKYQKWQQHMETVDETTKDFVHRMVASGIDDEDVAGWGDRENSRLSTACYCEQTFTVVLYLAYKYGTDDVQKAFCQNVMLGGHSTARGAVLGAILVAAHGRDNMPFVDDLCAKRSIDKEIADLVATI